MRRTTTLFFTVLTLVAALAVFGSAYALDGTNGYSATEVFTWGAVRDNISYDVGFTGVEWADMEVSRLGGGAGGDGPGFMDLDAAGGLFFLVHGSKDAKSAYGGFIHHDGTTYTHLMQERYTWAGEGAGGVQLWQVRVAPVTAGPLQAGHPVVLRFLLPGDTHEGTTDLVSVDPTASPPALTVVHAFTDTQPVHLRFDIAADGSIYVLRPPDGTIQRLSYNAATADYEVSTVPTSLDAGWDIIVGPDGALYTLDANDTPGGPRDKAMPIYRVDPVTGATSVYAQVKAGHDMFDWAWDSDGTLWATLTNMKPKKRTSHVARVPAASSATAISTSSARWKWIRGVAAGLDGAILVREYNLANADADFDAVSVLTPSGDGGGGGGKGNGKGKNK